MYRAMWDDKYGYGKRQQKVELLKTFQMDGFKQLVLKCSLFFFREFQQIKGCNCTKLWCLLA